MNQNKYTKWVLIGAGLLGLAGLAIYGNREARKAQAAYEVLDAHFATVSANDPHVSESNKFRFLLESRFGKTHLRQLNADHDRIAFDEDRNAVYFVHHRRPDSSKSCLATVYANEAEGNLSSHCGLLPVYGLTALSLEGRLLLVTCKVSDAEHHDALVWKLGMTPGEVLTKTVDLEETLERGLRASDLGLPQNFLLSPRRLRDRATQGSNGR